MPTGSAGSNASVGGRPKRQWTPKQLAVLAASVTLSDTLERMPGTLSRAQLAELFTVAEKTVDTWRKHGLPHFLAPTGTVLFDPKKVAAWWKGREISQAPKREQARSPSNP
jgi:hypothetical protein